MNKKTFIQGPILASVLLDLESEAHSRPVIGAQNYFIGKVRADILTKKKVAAIEFSSYESMALKTIAEVQDEALEKFDIIMSHVLHSQGFVQVGDTCFIVVVYAGHRKASIQATDFIVDQVKKRAPIFGKEVFEDHTHQWKINK